MRVAAFAHALLAHALPIIGWAVFQATPATAQVRPAPARSSAAEAQDVDQSPVLPSQQQPLPQPSQTTIEPNLPGRIARSSVGQVGQRQTRAIAAEQAGIEPMARIANRVQNRVQNRIRNRIDRNYNPQATAADPFAIAEDQARSTGRPR